MKQIFAIVLLWVLLVGCNDASRSNSVNGVARIRATALAAQQRDAASRPQPASAPAPVETATPIQQAATNDDNYGIALLLMTIIWLIGFVAGVIVTLWGLSQQEVKRGQANAQ